MHAKIRLSPLAEADSRILFEWINDRDQVLLNAPYKPVHEASHHAWFEAVQSKADLFIFGIRTDDDRLIGSCQLLNVNLIHRNAELQIRLGDVPSRGKGWGTEAVRLLLRYGFHDLNLHRVYLQVFDTNAAAQRSYQKAGFSREGLLREAAHIDGRYIDMAVMSILRSEYEALEAADGSE